MTSWTDKAGRRLVVAPADDLNPARLEVAHPDGEEYGFARFWLDGNADLAEIAVALFAANGQPAPVITPRPDVDTSEPASFRGFRLVAVDLGRQVRVEAAGDACEVLPPHAVRQLAGLLVAFADAAEAAAGPDPADVARLALLIEDNCDAARAHPHGGVTVYSDTLARELLRSGVRLPEAGGDRG